MEKTYKLLLLEEELGVLSDCVISQIQNVNKAKELVTDEAALKELDNAAKRLSALNAKVCGATTEKYIGKV